MRRVLHRADAIARNVVHGRRSPPVAHALAIIFAAAVESVGQAVEQEAADELGCVERHQLALVRLSIVAPAEPDPGLVDGHEPAVGDRHAMGVAPEIGEHLVGGAERRFGIDDPADLAQALGLRCECSGLGQRGALTAAGGGKAVPRCDAVGEDTYRPVREELAKEGERDGSRDARDPPCAKW